MKFLYLAVYACVVSFLHKPKLCFPSSHLARPNLFTKAFRSFAEVSCWMVTGERQSARIRVLYLKTILRQDIGFFDTETSTGEVIGRMSGDTILIQDSMGEKVSIIFLYIGCFLRYKLVNILFFFYDFKIFRLGNLYS